MKIKRIKKSHYLSLKLSSSDFNSHGYVKVLPLVSHIEKCVEKTVLSLLKTKAKNIVLWKIAYDLDPFKKHLKQRRLLIKVKRNVLAMSVYICDLYGCYDGKINFNYVLYNN